MKQSKPDDTIGSLLMANIELEQQVKALIVIINDRNKTIFSLNKMLDRISFMSAAVSEFAETGEEDVLRDAL